MDTQPQSKHTQRLNTLPRCGFTWNCSEPDHLICTCSRANTHRAPHKCKCGRVFRDSRIRPRKLKCPSGHLYSEVNTYIDPKGKKHCRACNNVKAKNYRRAQRY